METRTLSSAGFKHELSPQELYVLSRHWLSDITFSEVEMKYFKSRLAGFLDSENERHISRADLLQRQLNEIIFFKDLLKEKIFGLQQQLEVGLNDPDMLSSTSLNLQFSRMEGEFGDFIRSFRHLKCGFFTAWANSTGANAAGIM